jgi:hypothetical protein
MIGKIIGAFAGAKAAESTSAIGGTTGAILGVGAATIARRMSLPVLAAVTVGGYLWKRHQDKKTAAAPAVAPAAN